LQKSAYSYRSQYIVAEVSIQLQNSVYSCRYQCTVAGLNVPLNESEYTATGASILFLESAHGYRSQDIAAGIKIQL
jgi:hypothetical protein